MFMDTVNVPNPPGVYLSHVYGTLGRRQTLSLVIRLPEQIKNMTELFRPNAPYLTVDCVLFDEDAVVLIRRGHLLFKVITLYQVALLMLVKLLACVCTGSFRGNWNTNST